MGAIHCDGSSGHYVAVHRNANDGDDRITVHGLGHAGHRFVECCREEHGDRAVQR